MSGTLNTTQYVGSGPGNSDSDSGTNIVSGGLQYVGYDYGTGTATDTTISSGGEQAVGYLNGTGFATSTTILSGGYQDVGDVYGTGTATYTSIGSGGSQYVGYHSGVGYATSTTIDGGTQYVGESGGIGSAESTIISGGSQYVGISGGTGTATDTTIYSGGYQGVGAFNGIGTAIGTTISGGEQDVGVSGGTGYATSTTIASGGVQAVGYYSGVGSATGTTILSGGEQDVGDVNGTGTATDTTIDAGAIQYVGYNSGVGYATNTTVGGTQYVGGQNGTGYATSTTVDSGGIQIVDSGGTATDTTVLSGGTASILSGGVADAPVISGGTLILDAGASIGSGGIQFAAVSGANGGTLDLTGLGAFLSSFTAAISGFTGTGDTAAASDTIKVAGAAGIEHIVWSQDTASQGTLLIEDASNVVLEKLTLDGTYSQDQFVLNESTSVDEITYFCFMAGTLVRTPAGEAAIETLKRGDLVLTCEGIAKPVNWIGRQTISLRFADPLRVLPIRVRAGALDENVPARDLLVSPDHALLVDDVLIHAGALVNGTSITRETNVPKIFVYYHVELDEHSLIFAENTPAETFVDNVERLNFDNWAEFEALYPQGKAVEELPYPRAKARRQVPMALRVRLAGRAQQLAPEKLAG
ncbi:Hint domain-containing protein [Rhodoblastus acidophilus]|uniref:Hint domain-containing protein n=2 Tax=Pseudomonadota TaxID=1224 RepID=A0ABS9Z7K5_9HYPH|nr:Hint domain-containing protein [Candidatus Rhodoblastus alkanivorans]MCI4679647.1 Hint domain-containing protein [Candidatus Rhodoblastus alkanivorans]MCI4683683.1 Hint domain-containing protein [Candidatus Rhodoblastus alkanivorans]MDI4641000.1 Hint domain-containing protein [Rhodoblastus acidophilus]